MNETNEVIETDEITFDEYQKQARTTALYLNGINTKYPDLPEGIKKILALSYVGLGLGEVGEVQNKLKKIIRDSQGELSDEIISNLLGELGDIMWYVANTCEELGLKMGDVAQSNLNKLFSRQERGVIQGAGDKR